MPKLSRIVPVLVLALFAFPALASAQMQPATTQFQGGWAKPAAPGSTTNADGFVPAPRTPNMIWQSSLIAHPTWAASFTQSDFAFKGNLAINAEYQNFRIVDISDPRNPVTLSNQPCPGSQGDVVVFDNIVVRGHEGTHGVPFGDMNRVCETGGNEIQTVSLSGFDENGDSFRLQLSGGGQSNVITRGTNYTTAGIQAAILATPGWPAGGTVTISALSDAGFTMTFAGAWAAQDVPDLSVVAGTGGTTGTVVETRKGTPAPAWRGMSLHDISDQRNPKLIKGISICGSTHTITKYFDDVTNTMYVFGSGGGTTTNRPEYGLTECSGLPASRGDVIEIPRNNPSEAKLLQQNYIPMGFNGSCHDSNAFEELHLIAVACSGGGGASLVDVSDFKNPKVLWTYTYPGLSTTHSAAFSWDGKYVYINGEPGGGSGAECAFDDDTIKPMIHVLETATGKLVGMWMLPRPQDRVNLENCTTHTINTVPIVGKHIIANSCYMCGISVIDITNPRAAQEVGYVDPIAPQTGTAGDGCWTGYWYNDNMYCNELSWGMHVFTVSDEWWKQAMTFEELNPQTNTRLIRCNVSVAGVPARAGKAKRVTVKATLYGPAPEQPGYGLKVRLNGPGIGKTVTTAENGTAAVQVRATRAGRITARIAPAANLPFGCDTTSRRIKAALKPKKKRAAGGGGASLTGRPR